MDPAQNKRQRLVSSMRWHNQPYHQRVCVRHRDTPSGPLQPRIRLRGKFLKVPRRGQPGSSMVNEAGHSFTLQCVCQSARWNWWALAWKVASQTVSYELALLGISMSCARLFPRSPCHYACGTWVG